MNLLDYQSQMLNDKMNFFGGSNNGGNGGQDSKPTDNFKNPGGYDPNAVNPYIGNQIQGYHDVFNSMQPTFQGLMDPHRLDPYEQTMKDRSYTDTMNQYAARGMSGSSAAMGAVSNGSNNIDLQFQQYGLQNPMHAMQMQDSLLNPMMSDTMGAQGQYNGFQQAYLNYLLGQQKQDGSIIGGMSQGMGTLAGIGMGMAFL